MLSLLYEELHHLGNEGPWVARETVMARSFEDNEIGARNCISE
jgi:hypothetical protein